MSLDFELTDVHVLITGASGGIGVALVKTFLSLGCRVTAQYNSSGKSLHTLYDGLEPQKREYLYSFQANVTSEADVAKLFATAQSVHGIDVHALVVNHGIFPTTDVPLADMSLAQWRNTLSVNLDGTFLLCRDFLRQFRSARPSVSSSPAISITLIGSTAGKYGEANHADYAASKSAIQTGLLLSLKNEIVAIAPKGRVNAVNPGWVRTPMAEEIVKDEARMKRALATTPLQKIATPEDVARQVAVLVSPALSGHVSGVGLQVDGGMEGRVGGWF
ncbi:3-oxoacyl-[acyl-carrier-protein] 1, chloroplastic [Cyphellophora attinorum]|uniref:3-oxoacyl-[acyl-carrier-protein] 1, chloroplastic n=1 Tax=Cyphellophora attinorum TaxID=1664694 RepID=A0A0N1HFD8_9EURO|nr:3-oxoacyl-[acyl-carrier-protein] 1, chloroplastic [Phialophora attinorum]KPI43995.1 3-oxoacyl-[acyl-carrier-protein] 1, chloroplastic [Phialophora attinorum]